MTAIKNFPAAIMISDIENQPDWQAALYRFKRQTPTSCGFLLRDYDHPQRTALAHTLYKECRCLNITFFMGGKNPRNTLAKADIRHHSPEGLVGSYHRRHYRDTAAAHSLTAIHKAAQAGYGGVLISPVFATAKHSALNTQNSPLGLMRFLTLARYADRLGLVPYALGGMEWRQWQVLRGALPTLGFAAMRYFYNK